MFEIPKKIVKRPYEAVWILHSDTSLEEQKKIIGKNKEVIESFSGSLRHVDSWGKRRLANPIKKNLRANYFYATFEADAAAISELERTLRINDKVLRFLHVRLKEGTDLDKHLEQFRDILSESAKRDREREAKAQRRSAARAAGGMPGPGKPAPRP